MLHFMIKILSYLMILLSIYSVLPGKGFKVFPECRRQEPNRAGESTGTL